MNKTIALAAITLVAVIMGLSSFAPAAMASPNGNGSHNSAKVFLCHLDVSGTGNWEVIEKNIHAAEAHKGHGDLETTTQAQKDACVNNNDGSID